MGKSITLLATILVICALLVGGIAGYAFHPDTKEVIRNVAGPEVKVPVEVIKEVTKEVIKEVPLDIKATYLDKAIKDLIEYLDDEDELECLEDTYKIDEVSVARIYENLIVDYEDDDNYAVSGTVKLDFKQADEKRCRKTLNFKVAYDEDEVPVATI